MLGPECYAKFSGLEAVLEQHGLEALAQGPLTLPMRQVSEEGWGYPPEVLEFKARAERVGLRLEVQLEPTEHGPVVHLALRASAAGRPRLLKELDRHRQFEQRLRREQLAQEMAQEMAHA
ncbi:MAG TPA: hypothetical protein VNJ87_00085 [Candidatus Macondimonas sp.]|nr:hypothetical protein [Candidatus Macondimonas sp.]